MNFSETHARYSSDIAVTALSQRVPGLDYDDVVSEMTMCLWKACQTYRSDAGGFGNYWWSLWLNRRSNIARDAYRIKRPRVVVVGDWGYLPEGQYLMDLFPNEPTGADPTARVAWRMLAQGYKPGEVMERCGLTRRGYYNLIQKWRTPEVRNMLSR